MTIAEIQRWLDHGSPFDEGRELFLHFIQEGAVRKLLLKNAKESSFLRKKIKAALQDVLSQHNEQLPVATAVEEHRDIAKTTPVVQDATTKADNYPEILQKRITEKKELYRIAQEVRQRLFSERDLSKRAELYKHLYDLKVNQIDEIWRELDFFDQTGEVLTVEHREMTLPEILKRRNNVRTYVSRYRGDADRWEKLQEYEKELIILNQLYERAIQIG